MSKYSPEVMERVRQCLNLGENDESCDLDIAGMSRDNIFDHCLCWEGIIGFGQMIKEMVENIYDIKLEGE